jgi:hypothetical protein
MKITSTQHGFSAEFTAENGKQTELQFDAVKKEDETFFNLTAHPHWGDPIEITMNLTEFALLGLRMSLLAAESVLTEEKEENEAAQS